MGKKLKVLELFAGTRSIGKAFEKLGHEVYSVEMDEQHENIDWYADITKISAYEIRERFGQPDIVWASPPCQRFSVASIGHHWIKGTNDPKTKEAEEAMVMLRKTLDLINELNPTYYFIENPRGKMRKVEPMERLNRYTVTYCQYGDSRMKPTDIWTNHPNPRFRPICKNGAPCHVSAPRGSQTGTQGLKGSVLRSIIPEELCDHIAEISEDEPMDTRYRLVDIQDETDVTENVTLEYLQDFLTHMFTEDEFDDLRFFLMTFQEVNASLEGIDYYAEEMD